MKQPYRSQDSCLMLIIMDKSGIDHLDFSIAMFSKKMYTITDWVVMGGLSKYTRNTGGIAL